MLAGGGSHLSSSSLPGGRSFLFGNTWFMLSAYPARLLHTADRRAPAAAFVAAIHRTPRAVRAHGGTGQTLLQRGIIMAACGYAFGRAELGAAKRQLEKDSSLGNHTSRIVVSMGSAGSAAAARPDVSFKYRGVEYYKKVGASLKCREQLVSSRTFWTSAAGPGRKLSFSVEPWARDFSTSCVAPYPAGATERQLTMDNPSKGGTGRRGRCGRSPTRCSTGSPRIPRSARRRRSPSRRSTSPSSASTMTSTSTCLGRTTILHPRRNSKRSWMSSTSTWMASWTARSLLSSSGS